MYIRDVFHLILTIQRPYKRPCLFRPAEQGHSTTLNCHEDDDVFFDNDKDGDDNKREHDGVDDDGVDDKELRGRLAVLY